MKAPPPIRIPMARPMLGPEERKAVLSVLASGQLAEGPRTLEFERALRRVTGAKHAVAVANGTCALHLALLAAGVRPGDRVAVPAFSFVATANAVLMAGATPVFVDVSDDTFNMDPRRLAGLAQDGVKAVMPVHLYGHPADMDALKEASDRIGATLVGDAAQAIGARYHGTPVGSTAPLESFSFYPTKNITTGEGGLVTTSDPDLDALLRSLRNHGRAAVGLGTYDHVRLGWNYRLTDLAAAIGLAQLRKLSRFTEARRRNARQLNRILKDVEGLVPPREEKGCRHVYHQYTVRVTGGPDARKELQDHLRRAGIGCAAYYPKPLHAYPHLAAYAHADLRVSERLSQEVLSLPVNPALTDRQVREVAETVSEWASGQSSVAR